MSGEGSWVGLDVHARSVVGCAIDESAGEMRTQRIGARTDQIVGWVRAQPGPVVACYEAGPTGFGLARALHAARGAIARWWPRRSWSARPGTRSRPTAATRNGSRGCCASGRSRGCGCPPRPRKRPGIWCELGRTAARSDAGAAPALQAAAASRAGLGTDRLDRRAHRLAAQSPLRSARGAARLRQGPRHDVHGPCAPRPPRRRDRRDGRDRAAWPGRSGGCAACAGSRP